MNTKLFPALLVVSACLGLLTDGRAHSAVEPAPRGDRGWTERQELLNQRAREAGEKAQVIFIGDSITQGWEGAGKEVWEKYYASRHAVNLGIGGDRTQHVLWRLDNGNLAGLKPKAAVLMIGTNNSNGEDNTPGQIADGITAIVKKLREKLPSTKILLVAIFPRSENYSVQRGKLAMINQVIRRQVDDKNVYWVDFGHQFLGDDGTIPGSLMPDFLHLSTKGYQIWAEAIEPLLAKVLGEKPVAGAGFAGEWVATLPGPNGDPVEIGLSLQQEGAGLTGKFVLEDGRSLAIQDASASGNEFKWTVVRRRSSGGTMTYQMSGRLENGKLAGKAETDSDGNPQSVQWSARRK